MVDVPTPMVGSRFAIEVRSAATYEMFFVETPLDIDDMDGYAPCTPQPRFARGREWQKQAISQFELCGPRPVGRCCNRTWPGGRLHRARESLSNGGGPRPVDRPQCWNAIGIAERPLGAACPVPRNRVSTPQNLESDPQIVVTTSRGAWTEPAACRPRPGPRVEGKRRPRSYRGPRTATA